MKVFFQKVSVIRVVLLNNKKKDMAQSNTTKMQNFKDSLKDTLLLMCSAFVVALWIVLFAFMLTTPILLTELGVKNWITILIFIIEFIAFAVFVSYKESKD